MFTVITQSNESQSGRQLENTSRQLEIRLYEAPSVHELGMKMAGSCCLEAMQTKSYNVTIFDSTVFFSFFIAER